MSTIGTVATLADFARRSDPNGKIMKIVELLSKDNPILKDMLWMEGNLPTGMLTTVRAGLPSATWRLLNYGVQPSKSKTKQVTDHCAMLEAYAEVDKKLAHINGNSAEWRLGEDMAFLEAMNIEMASTIFYGDDIVSPAKFVGLAPRYNATTGADSSDNVISAGGSTANKQTSIWFITWDQLSTHGIFPKGSKAGFQHQNLGEVTLDDADGGHYQGYRSHYSWDCGLTVRDWRRNVRVCNIDTTALSGSSAPKLFDFMTKAYHKLNRFSGKKVIYCNETIATYLDLQAQSKTNVYLTSKEVAGEEVTSFRGIPIRQCDAILDTEAVIS
ncbi:MAG: hypothetical protein RRY12_10785 [Cloacibacillus sp.]